MTSGQETERVYSYNPRARMGLARKTSGLRSLSPQGKECGVKECGMCVGIGFSLAYLKLPWHLLPVCSESAIKH